MDFFCPVYTELLDAHRRPKIHEWLIIGLITGCVLCCIGSCVLMVCLVIRINEQETRPQINTSLIYQPQDFEAGGNCTETFCRSTQLPTTIENLYHDITEHHYKAYGIFSLSVKTTSTKDDCKDSYLMTLSIQKDNQGTTGLNVRNDGVKIKHEGVYYIYTSVNFPNQPRCSNPTRTWSHFVTIQEHTEKLMEGFFTPCYACPDKDNGHIYLGGLFKLHKDDIVQFKIHPPSSNDNSDYGGLLMIESTLKH